MANQAQASTTGTNLVKTTVTTAPSGTSSGPTIPTTGQIWPPVYRQSH
jgi:hypothetical protein